MHHRHQVADCDEDKRTSSIWRRLLFLLIGIGSTLWFLVRVLPKPSRAAYPCMRAAAPIASSFVLYLLGLAASAVAWRKGQKHVQRSRYGMALLCLVLVIAAGLSSVGLDSRPLQADQTFLDNLPNQPMGEAQGIFPGRVVWVHDGRATKNDCVPTRYGHGWFLGENNDQTVIDQMLSTALRTITAQPGDAEAWHALFKYHNGKRGKGDVGYQTGEKVFIKTNATSAWSGNFNTSDLSVANNNYYGVSETSPQLVLSVLRHLVRTVGVAEKDIYVGDPMKHVYKHCYVLWHGEFPGVNYIDASYGAEKARLKIFAEASPSLFYSDKGQVLGSGYKSESIYNIFHEAEYVINIPTLKGHSYAGVTMFAKNHFGSITRDGASHLHKGLVATVDRGVQTRPGYALYRVQVDLMGHKFLSGKNLFYLMDALWSSDFEIGFPAKWRMTPFNNDWMSSVFVSLDPVAIESVGYDFLKAEFTGTNGLYAFPQMNGVDDYLHQAADSRNWPAGLSYDPENDGTPLTCLGVHEHWNNTTDKQYTRNLANGNGIELIQASNQTGIARTTVSPTDSKLDANYPNPFNPTTKICYRLVEPAQVELSVYSLTGQKVKTIIATGQSAGSHTAQWDGVDDCNESVAAGAYFYRLVVYDQTGTRELTRKMSLVR